MLKKSDYLPLYFITHKACDDILVLSLKNVAKYTDIDNLSHSQF